MDLRPGEKVIYKGHPSWRSTLGFYILGVLIAAVAFGIGLLAGGVGVAVVCGLVVFAILVIVGFLKRMTTRYTITDTRLYVRRGLLARHVEQTRLERLQDVRTSQTLLERILQVGTIDFDTASGEGGDPFKFKGISNPDDIVSRVDDAIHAASQTTQTPQPTSGL